MDEVIDQQEHQEEEKSKVQALLGELVYEPVEADQLDIQSTHHPF